VLGLQQALLLAGLADSPGLDAQSADRTLPAVPSLTATATPSFSVWASACCLTSALQRVRLALAAVLVLPLMSLSSDCDIESLI
jgi:hypothetical protein